MSRRDEQEIRQAIDIFERRLADHLARLVGQGNEDPLGPAGHGRGEICKAAAAGDPRPENEKVSRCEVCVQFVDLAFEAIDLRLDNAQRLGIWFCI